MSAGDYTEHSLWRWMGVGGGAGQGCSEDELLTACLWKGFCGLSRKADYCLQLKHNLYTPFLILRVRYPVMNQVSLLGQGIIILNQV